MSTVHDLDSVLILYLLHSLRGGLEQDSGREVACTPFDFFARAFVNPYKVREPDLLMQLFKMQLKIAAGAKFIITQIGYNLRKLYELKQYMARENMGHVPLLANVYVPTSRIARMGVTANITTSRLLGNVRASGRRLPRNGLLRNAAAWPLCAPPDRLVQHISNKVYYNWLVQDGSPRDLVNVLRREAYVSLESGLREYGISTQSPRTLTCVTTERPKEFQAGTIAISYRSITRRLYWGFVRNKTRYGSYLLAEPEKAILDWIYLGIQNGAAPALDELCAPLPVIHLSAPAAGSSRKCGRRQASRPGNCGWGRRRTEEPFPSGRVR